MLVGVAQAEPGRAVVTVVLTAVFIGTMLLLRPLVLRLVRYQEARGPLTQGTIAVVFVALLVSALARQVREKLEDLVLVFLLPAFFAFTGLRTEIGLVESAADWTACLVIILLASAGKFGGS